LWEGFSFVKKIAADGLCFAKDAKQDAQFREAATPIQFVLPSSKKPTVGAVGFFSELVLKRRG